MFTSGFVRPFPANVHKCVVRVRPSLGDQAIAFGLSIGGRVAVMDPQHMGAGLADSTFPQLCQPIVTGRHGACLKRPRRRMPRHATERQVRR